MDSVSPPDDGGRTAIYDIAAHVVYLPNGHRLEAHSGLGNFMDNLRHVHLRMSGATPPNVYKLSLREQLFHGVRAIRLTPIGSGKMYGRAGILAHSYMLGQSNGCVSFRNYPEFLNAYLRGEITRLVVVEYFENPPPGPKVASGWLDAIASVHQRALSVQAVQGHRLNDGKQVLDTMIELADNQPLPLFYALAFAYVDQNDEHEV